MIGRSSGMRMTRRRSRSAIAAATGLPAVADDSGLEVDALYGMPGVLSARWSGRHGDDAANTALLLGQLGDVPDERRGAAFVFEPAGKLSNFLWTSFIRDSIISACPSLFCLSCSMR